MIASLDIHKRILRNKSHNLTTYYIKAIEDMREPATRKFRLSGWKLPGSNKMGCKAGPNHLAIIKKDSLITS